MRYRRLGAVAALGAGLFAWAGVADAQSPSTICRAQAERVEHARGLPPGLLLAVGRVESGRTAADGRDILPWPWSVNDEGTDHVFAAAFDAIAYVVAARGRGSRSLDVGCFQVNLQSHPDAFATVAAAFDPAANADYAGALLAQLHARAGSWAQAVEMYHSATPWRGETYRDRVLSRWADTSLAAAPGQPPPTEVQPGVRPEAPPVAPALPHPLPVPPSLATRLRPPAAGSDVVRGAGWTVRVQHPTGSGAAAPIASGGRLPRVIVPSSAGSGPDGNE